ncbi:hypothetical protein [Streptomyces sp. NPDC060366]|uniref:hypothetical protein n=1 Tax=Streptomyces sp. NPDC060366 TaxID=3347105 RepID=UPI00365BE3D1
MRNTADGEYLAGLATELRHSSTVNQAAEDELAHLRGVMARVAAFINNPNNDQTACRALAIHLGLPAPRTNTPKETRNG